MNKGYCVLETRRTAYAPSQIKRTLTVGDLISQLEQYDDDTPVVYSNDNGYTYGQLYFDDVHEYYDEDEEEEDEEDEEDY